MADQEFWRQEQARADAARIKRAQGRDGTWVSTTSLTYLSKALFSGESGTGKRITATNEKVLIGHAARRPPPETKAVTAEAALKDHPDDPDIKMSHLADDTGTDVVIIGEKTMLDQVYLIVVNQGPTVSQSEISDEPEKKTNSNETNIDFNQLFSLASKEDPETDTATEKNVKANAKM